MWLHSNATRNQQGGVHYSSELRYRRRNLYNSLLCYFTCSSVLVHILRLSVGPGVHVNKTTSLKSHGGCVTSFCAGLVEIEEGELTAQRLELQSQAVARTSFAKEPHVQQVSVLATPTPYCYLSVVQPWPRWLSFDLSDLQNVPATTRRQAWADCFHGNGQQATNAALAYYLPPGSLTRTDGTLTTA